VVSYLKLFGMFELKDGQSYDTYKGINRDPFTWKEYPLDSSLIMNQHDMVELHLNISDTELMGSDSSLEKMKEVISRYQLKFNNIRLK